MKSINQVTLLGNLTRNPVLRYTPNGTAVINFSIATNRSYKDKETDEWKDLVDYHNIVFWSKSAEIISQYCLKGSKILVQGRLQTRSWEGKDGVKRYTTEIVGQDFILLTPKSGSEVKVNQPPVKVKKEATGDSAIIKEAEEIFGSKATDVKKPKSEHTGDSAQDFQNYLDNEEEKKGKKIEENHSQAG